MYLTSMTHEELYAEVHKDLIEISTQANMFMDKVRKKTKNMLPYPLATQRITLTTTRRNVWTVVGKHNSYMLTPPLSALQAMAISKCRASSPVIW